MPFGFGELRQGLVNMAIVTFIAHVSITIGFDKNIDHRPASLALNKPVPCRKTPCALSRAITQLGARCSHKLWRNMEALIQMMERQLQDKGQKNDYFRSMMIIPFFGGTLPNFAALDSSNCPRTNRTLVSITSSTSVCPPVPLAKEYT